MPAFCYTILNEPAAGDWNMAVDEALLNESVANDLLAVRCYAWAQPTVSLGHFQAKEPLVIDARFEELHKVRRLSGGGAILHHHEVTYSCCVPVSHSLTRNPGDIYDLAHEVVMGVLREFGVASSMRGEKLDQESRFLCFSRGDPRDIVIGAHKIVGSAQRRRRGAVLQHGSILIRRSEHAPEFPGISDLTGMTIDEQRLAEMVAAGIAQKLGTPSPLTHLPPNVQQHARQLVQNYQE
ncbi:MAG: hypothetical protein KDA88_16005 [Planctomycetaceae bacterium]|nr:hypothetical protein [Planctomycetaceae bacterium]